MNLNDTIHGMSTIVQTDTPYSSSQGTGFFYGRLDPSDGDGPQWRRVNEVWLVTNRHVLLPRIGEHEVLPTNFTFNLRKADPSGILQWEPVMLSIAEIGRLAKFHPDKQVDVAVLDISEAVIGRMEKIDQGFGSYLLYLLHCDKFAGNNNIDVEASSDVLVVGYPRGFYDDVNLFPIVKSGIIASRWGVGFQGKPYFLVDAKLFPGSSGSAVISKPTDLVVKGGQLLSSNEKQFAFLGIFSGEPKYEESPVVVGDLTITQSSGFNLGIVWYADLVEEIIDKGIPLNQALAS